MSYTDYLVECDKNTNCEKMNDSFSHDYDVCIEENFTKDASAVTSCEKLNSMPLQLQNESLSIDNITNKESRIKGSFESDETSDEFVNQQNQAFLYTLEQYEAIFLPQLRHTDFEDGMRNEIIDRVDALFKKNPFVSCNWVYKVFSENQSDYKVICGLLRVVASLDAKGYAKYLLPLVRAGLSDENSMTQEAAIMVIEEWRTKECLVALEHTSFASLWIKDYAEEIITELKSELV